MKQIIRKPIYWQDFEDLCKVLWGEIWGVQDKIKKNGRSGNSQNGVDIYAVPKNKLRYSGIQCKGKDDYSNAVLSKKEIDTEIEKAKTFKPELEVFIFATSANKDAEIEQYVREKDLESRLNGGFEIILYCWEDIADLVERNRETFNYLVSNKQFKSTYAFELTFSGGTTEYTLSPTFKKTISKYKLSKPSTLTNRFPNIKHDGFDPKLSWMMTEHKNVNCSWTSFTINFKNTGSEVIEDYKLYIYPEENKIRGLTGVLGGVLEKLNFYKHSHVYVNEEEKYAVYSSNDNKPLIQKDSRSFDLHILANHDIYQLKLKYELLARNFNDDGELILNVDPVFDTKEQTIWVDDEILLEEDSVTYEDNMVAGGLF